SDGVRVLRSKQFHGARGMAERDDYVADEFFAQALSQRLPIHRAHSNDAVVKRLFAGLDAALLRGRECHEVMQPGVIDRFEGMTEQLDSRAQLESFNQMRGSRPRGLRVFLIDRLRVAF